MESTYYLIVMNVIRQETQPVIVKGQSKLALVLSRLPEHRVVISVENLGPVIESDQFLEELHDDDQGLNFGGQD